jgi:cytochrome c oxidase subunit II
MRIDLTPIFAILLGDLGLSATFLAELFGVCVVITAIGLGLVLWSTKHPEEGNSHALAKFEKHWTVFIFVVLIVFTVTTINFLPYPYAHSNVHPNMTIDVTGQQFAWTLCDAPYWANASTSLSNPFCFPNNNVTYIKIVPGDTVLFNVTSHDVTHGFGLYQCTDALCSTAQLIDQVQVMPDFYNSIIYTFSRAGVYYIRCLEFCGFGHYTMISELNVTKA